MAEFPKMRLDQLLVERGLVDSRSRAQAIILAGKVLVGEQRIDKAGTRVRLDATLRIKEADHPYVSRGGVKLEGALCALSVEVRDVVALDVGASTGGFTDCLLSHGASKVYALDVGRSQLHNRLLQDPRVVSMPGINVRLLGPQDLPEPVDVAVFDLSFISLKLVLPPVLPHVKSGGRLLLLVKPQFEVGKGQVGKGGIVRDESLRLQALEDIAGFARTLGLAERGRAVSCLPGTDGNIEFFLYLMKP